jgi:hypothetical protein
LKKYPAAGSGVSLTGIINASKDRVLNPVLRNKGIYLRQEKAISGHL